MTILSPYGIANIIAHVTLIAVLIGIFYFTYVPVVEKEVVKREVDEVMTSIADDIHDFIPKKDLQFLKPLIDKYVQAPNMEKEDKEAASQNRAIMFKAMKYLGLFLGVSSVVVLGIWKFFGIDLSQMLVTNAFLLVAVGITYFFFVTVVIKNYRSADPNFIKKRIVQTLKTFSSN